MQLAQTCLGQQQGVLRAPCVSNWTRLADVPVEEGQCCTMKYNASFEMHEASIVALPTGIVDIIWRHVSRTRPQRFKLHMWEEAIASSLGEDTGSGHAQDHWTWLRTGICAKFS